MILGDRADLRVPVGVERVFVFLAFPAPKKAITDEDPPAGTQKREEPAEPLLSLLLLRNRIQDDFASGMIKQVEAQKFGAFAEQLEFTGSVEEMVSGGSGV
ncbi:MAG TPA: hypothetical protein VGY99_29835, partial [Candidatus Binataceae bacterium]|nr:hypothetical protein [Candidatus Binataceae bacterium]